MSTQTAVLRLRPDVLLIWGLLLVGVVLWMPGCGGEPNATDARAAAALPAAAQAGGTAPEPVIPADAPVVVFLGDSLSAGMHLAADEAFPAVLQRRLAKAGTPFRLVNAGVSGDTTAGGLARVEWLLKQSPDLVVVELGANDAFRGLALKETESNLRKILERIRAQGAAVLLLGMKLPPNYGADYAQGFEALYVRLAEETKVAFVPFFLEGVAGVPALNLPDGIHPTAEGHRRVAAALQPTISGLLVR